MTVGTTFPTKTLQIYLEEGLVSPHLCVLDKLFLSSSSPSSTSSKARRKRTPGRPRNDGGESRIKPQQDCDSLDSRPLFLVLSLSHFLFHSACLAVVLLCVCFSLSITSVISLLPLRVSFFNTLSLSLSRFSLAVQSDFHCHSFLFPPPGESFRFFFLREG